MTTQLSSILHPPSSNCRRLPSSTLNPQPRAFTLIELLVVISIIALLAAMLFPITGAVNRSKIRAKARAELAQVQIAIDSYKAKMGHYPPDNPGLPATNQLYYELLGTKQMLGGKIVQTLDGSASIALSDLGTVFGMDNGSPKVAGFVNCTKLNASEESAGATPFLRGLKPGQVGQGPLTAKVLACSIPLPETLPAYFGIPKVNPFCYNASNPTNNPNAYDLWVDVVIAGKINRICNWSQQPLIVSKPW
ncbi:MAG TPA: prepilin-type N-terminal cleavage/methylation domain-containing protein [Candidatus Sulfotelmatobacter sp.]|nr:prepilin-type N-terminal cleavage/methylation domain-containing protein [Candidatus Sulfotelmatobacter sp.]